MELRCPHCQQKNRIPSERLKEAPRCGNCKEAILKGVIEADPVMLKELIQQTSLPVLIDFWAPWCGPCRQFAPTFKAEAHKHSGNIVFVKVDTEAHPAVGQIHTIRSIPTLAAFWKGQEIHRISGALPASELTRLVATILAHSVSN